MKKASISILLLLVSSLAYAVTVGGTTTASSTNNMESYNTEKSTEELYDYGSKAYSNDMNFGGRTTAPPPAALPPAALPPAAPPPPAAPLPANNISFTSSTEPRIHYRAGNNGKHTRMVLRLTGNKIGFIVENQNTDWATRNISYSPTSNGFTENYSFSDARVGFTSTSNWAGTSTTGTYWAQTAYVASGRLYIKAEYRNRTCTRATFLRPSVCTDGPLQTAYSWLSVDRLTRTVTGSGMQTSANGKLRQGIIVDSSTNRICFRTNLYSIYSYTEGTLIDGVLDKSLVTSCINYAFN